MSSGGQSKTLPVKHNGGGCCQTDTLLAKESVRKKRQSGQLVLEYVLLMMVAVSMAALMKSRLIGGEPGQSCNEAPVLTALVCNLTFTIASDEPGG